MTHLLGSFPALLLAALSFSSGPSSATAAGGAPELAFGAAPYRLSALSSWRAGHRLHLGISTLDKSFDRCVLYGLVETPKPHLATAEEGGGRRAGRASLSPGQAPQPLQLGPQRIPVVGQRGAKPGRDLSDAFKWSANLELPASWIGERVRFQALLCSSTTGARVLTNQVSGTIGEPGPGEGIYAVAYASGSNPPVMRIARMDVDEHLERGVVGTVTKHNISEPVGNWNNGSWTSYFQWNAPPERSPDGRFVVLGWGRYKQNWTAEVGFAFVIDTSTDEHFDLPFHGTTFVPKQARFLPGSSTLLYVLEQSGVKPNNDSRIACYDLENEGALLSTVTIDSISGWWIVPSWDFDGSGRAAHFKSTSNATSPFGPGYLQSHAFAGGQVQATPTLALLDPNAGVGLYSYTRRHILSIPAGPNDSSVVTQWFHHTSTQSGQYRGPRKLAVGNGTGVSNPVVDSVSGEMQVQSVAPDGSYAIFAGDDHATRYRILDLRAPILPGQELVELPSVWHPWIQGSSQLVVPVRGDVHVAATGANGTGVAHLQRLAWNAAGTGIDAELVSGEWSSQHRLAAGVRGTNADNRKGQGCALQGRSGVMMRLYGEVAALYDAETMTHVAAWDLTSVIGGLDAEFLF